MPSANEQDNHGSSKQILFSLMADRRTFRTEGLVKPDIVFFGESLPARFFQYMATDFSKADLLIVMGTSLTVQPFASLIGQCTVPKYELPSTGSDSCKIAVSRHSCTPRAKDACSQALFGKAGSHARHCLCCDFPMLLVTLRFPLMCALQPSAYRDPWRILHVCLTHLQCQQHTNLVLCKLSNAVEGTSLLLCSCWHANILYAVADKVRSDVPRMLINREKVGEAEPELKRLGVEHGFNFGEGNYRDVLYLGNCDDGVAELCALLGWTEDLQKLIKMSHNPQHEAHNPMKSPAAL